MRLQIGMAQSTAEEAIEVANNVEDRIQAVENTMVSKAEVESMITKAVKLLETQITDCKEVVDTPKAPQPTRQRKTLTSSAAAWLSEDFTKTPQSLRSYSI